MRDGLPLLDFNVELVNEHSPLGLWQRTDAQGRPHAAATDGTLPAARYRLARCRGECNTV
jgi:hypothetical protein